MYVVAAGRCYHAGAGNWQGFTRGNTNFIGIEAENTGFTRGPKADPWPTVQMDAYRRGVAAILKKIRANAIMVCGHKEYALPPGRKIDPTFDMNDFRLQVAAIMAGTAPLPYVIPAVDGEGRKTLRRGARGIRSSKCRRSLASPRMAPSMLVPKPRSDVFSGTTDWFRMASSVLEPGLRSPAKRLPPMSALGHKQTLEQASEMSALPTKADMRLAVQKCPLSANSRHWLRRGLQYAAAQPRRIRREGDGPPVLEAAPSFLRGVFLVWCATPTGQPELSQRGRVLLMVA